MAVLRANSAGREEGLPRFAGLDHIGPRTLSRPECKDAQVSPVGMYSIGMEPSTVSRVLQVASKWFLLLVGYELCAGWFYVNLTQARVI